MVPSLPTYTRSKGANSPGCVGRKTTGDLTAANFKGVEVENVSERVMCPVAYGFITGLVVDRRDDRAPG